MYRLFSLALCLIMAGCNSEDSSGPGVAVAQANAAAPMALRAQAPPVIESPSQNSLVPPVVESPSEYSVVDDSVMEPPDEPPPAPEVPPPGPTSFPVLIFSYLADYFDRYHGDRSAHMARFHRAQVYSAFAHRLLAWFGRERSLEHETAVGVRTDSAELPAFDPNILRDGEGKRLYFDDGCTGSQCPQYADNPCSLAVNELRLQGMRESLIEKGYRGLWLNNVHFARPNGTLSISNGRGEFVRPVDPDTSAPMSNHKWNSCLADWVERVREAFPSAELAHNSLWFAVRDDHVRRQHLAADYIHLEHGFIDDDIMAGDGPFGFNSFLDYLDWAHDLGRTIIFGHDDGFMTAQEFEYALAAYFLVREGEDMFGINDTNRMLPGNWDSRLDLDLGAPLGPRQDNDGSYTRNFECGSVTVWGPPERLGQITQTACE